MLLAAVVLAALPDLTTDDWLSTDKSLYLSLRPVESHAAGAVWLYRETAKNEIVAAQGCYTLAERDGAPVLRLAFPRLWKSRAGQDGHASWEFDQPYFSNDDEARAVDLEITKTGTRLTLSALRFGRCNREGAWTGMESDAYLSFMASGEIITIQTSTDDAPLVSNPPPTYVRKSQWKRRVQTDPKTVFRTDNLKRDWYGWGSATAFYLLSATSTTDWDEGDAWLISCQDLQTSKRLTAARGQFRIFGEPPLALETLSLQFTVRRVYRGVPVGDTAVKWSVMPQEELADEAGFATFQIPLTDGALHAERQPLILERVSYVDASGKPIRRYTSEGFLGLKQRERTPYGFLGIDEGQAVVYAAGTVGASAPARSDVELAYVRLLEAAPPPGLELRSYRVEQTVARPVIPVPTPQPVHVKSDTPAQPPPRESKSGTPSFSMRSGIMGEAYPGADVLNTPPPPPRATPTRSTPAPRQSPVPPKLPQPGRVPPVSDVAAPPPRRPLSDREVIQAAEAELRIHPQNTDALNDLAWVLSTSSDPALRDGFRAIDLAVDACALTDYEDADSLDTLAAACAERRDFRSAIRWQTEALKYASDELRPSLEGRLRLYQQARPYREAPPR